MAERTRTVRIGTRGSALARWQTDYVADLLRAAWPHLRVEVQVISTRGDQVLDKPLPLIGGKGVFTAELEAALHEGTIDFAVHSLKDLPTENPAGIAVGATPTRATVNDAVVSRAGYTLRTLPQGATVGTSSRRRAAQLLYRRPDLQIADIRGNVDTRLRKALDADGVYDAIVLASAGLERLGRMDAVSELLSTDDMLPAPGQAALGIQCRHDVESLELLRPINDAATAICVTAERGFLAGLGGGCSLPIAAHAVIENGQLNVRGRVNSPDGSQQVDVEISGAAAVETARALGTELARAALDRGVGELLEALG
jgi:hydroxymethylbilane synthase